MILKFPIFFTIFFVVLSGSNTANAWIYSEHRDIAIQAIQNLDSEQYADFERLWEEARVGFEPRLCQSVAELTQGPKADCLDWAAFSAIAGDHSCSGKEMLDYVLTEQWILEIADISSHLKSVLSSISVEKIDDNDLKKSKTTKPTIDNFDIKINRAKRLNALRIADTQMLRADSHYAARASSNTAHFLIARPSPTTTTEDYGKLSLRQGSEINAMGVYAWYHIKALQKAKYLANEPNLSAKQRQRVVRAMLADEGFALHFLEDIFAAGHVAGTWGEVSQRLGTHNYYNQHGLETNLWNPKEFPVVLMGDAHIRQQDMNLAAKTISLSLKQVLDIAGGRKTDYFQPIEQENSLEAADFNVCTQNLIPKLKNGHKFISVLENVMLQTPIPGLAMEPGTLPRFRSEVGSFIGLSGSIDERIVDGGFLDFQDQKGAISSLDLSLRIGFGMEGVMGESGDGLVFASIGFHADSASTNKFDDSINAKQSGSLSAAIPSRTNFSARIRMPFYLIPGDLLLLSPLYLINESTYINIAATAGNGGLIPWQQGIDTIIGRFQFVLGRELGVTYYGWDDKDQLIIPAESETEDLRLYTLKSLLFDIPILEYRAFRSFSTNQSSSVVFQLFTSADVPIKSKPIIIDGESRELKTIWSVGLRLVFDWRHY